MSLSEQLQYSATESSVIKWCDQSNRICTRIDDAEHYWTVAAAEGCTIAEAGRPSMCKCSDLPNGLSCWPLLAAASVQLDLDVVDGLHVPLCDSLCLPLGSPCVGSETLQHCSGCSLLCLMLPHHLLILGGHLNGGCLEQGLHLCLQQCNGNAWGGAATKPLQ